MPTLNLEINLAAALKNFKVSRQLLIRSSISMFKRSSSTSRSSRDRKVMHISFSFRLEGTALNMKYAKMGTK